MPRPPMALWWLYEEFLLLSRRRQVGMDINPISDLDLEAFCRRRLLALTSWQKDLLFQLDDAAMAAFRGDRRDERERARRKAEGTDALIPVSNVKGLKGLFRGLALRKDAEANAKG